MDIGKEFYGPFVVKPIAPLSLNKAYDNQNAYAGRSFEIKYTITPNDIPVNDLAVQCNRTYR